MEAATFGWREGILLLVGLAVAYLLFAVVKLVRIGRQREESFAIGPPRDAAEFGDRIGAAATAATAPPTDTPLVEGPAETVEQIPMRREEAAPMPATPPSPPIPPVVGFEEHLAERLARLDIEREVRDMRRMVDVLRAEVDGLRAELRDLRKARNISPHYSEALELVQRGMNAQEVADRMDISLAEAELVYALGRGEREED